MNDELETSSPLRPLFKMIALSPAWMMQGREVDFQSYIKGNNISLLFDREDGMGPRVQRDEGKNIIILPIPYLERYWCYSYVAVCLTDFLWSHGQPRGETLNMHTDPDLALALDLLKWAMNRRFGLNVSSWPIHLPRPTESPAIETKLFDANEIFFVITGAIMHHEISHALEPQWSSESDLEASRYEESLADQQAFSRMVINKQDSPELLEKKSIGIMLFYLCMSCELLVKIYVNINLKNKMNAADFGDGTHPLPTERLKLFINSYYSSESKNVWIMGWMFLGMFITNIEIPIVRKEYRDNKECFLQYISAVEDWINSVKPQLL